jgi:glycosyltransferase involved in cell wall biosynthesis
VYEAFFWKMEEQRPANTVPLSRNHGNRIVLHELTNYTSCGELARICLSPNNRLLVSFLDVQDYYYPENFTDKSLTLRRLHYSFYKDRGDLFLAISEFTKQTMIEKLGIDGGKIIVTQLAADHCQKVQPSLDTVEWATTFGRFLIYPSKAWPHKNHAFLFRAMAHRRDELRKAGIQLLLTGGFYPVDEQLLGELIQQNGIQDLVQVLGFLTNEQLNALLSKAEYLIFPSLFEGFGMPVLEAMSLGCPVMSSTSASLPEVGGDAAIYFDPANEESLISLLDDMTKGNIDRQSYIEKGFMNCKRFSWETTYRKTIMAYRELLL